MDSSPKKAKNSSKITTLQDEVEFELAFYRAVAGGEFEIISIPCPDGYFLTDQEKNYIAQLAVKDKIKLLYSIKLKNYNVVFGLDGHKIGIIPEDSRGFYC